MPGTCEKIGFANFRTTYFHQLTLWVTDGNSIFSHVPGTAPPPLWVGILSDFNVYTPSPRLFLTKVIVYVYTHRVDSSR